MSFLDGFVAGGFKGQIAEDFILIILAMFIFTFLHTKLAKRLWDNSKGQKVDFQKIVNYTAIIFPAAFVWYALFGLDLSGNCQLGSCGPFSYAGGALLFHSLDHDILARVFNTVNGGHIICWIAILGAYYSVMYMEAKPKWKSVFIPRIHNSIPVLYASGSQYYAGKALLTGLGLIALSEFHWNTYYLVYLVFVSKSFASITEGGFIISQMWLLTVILIWYQYYKKFFLRMLPIVLPVTTLFFAYWFSIGFPITLTSNATTDPNIITQWYSNLFVNGALEIGSWIMISVITTIAYWFVKNHIYTKIETSVAILSEAKIKEFLNDF